MNQVLTQEEINSLLRGLSDGDIEEDSVEVDDEAPDAIFLNNFVNGEKCN